MRNLFKWLAHRRQPKFNETVFEEAGHDASEIRNAYRDLVAHELRRWAIPESAFRIDVIQAGDRKRSPNFVVILCLHEWEPAATLPLLLGLPFLDRKLRKAVQAHWLGDVSAFNGIWLHASEQMLASPGIGDLRELLGRLTNVRVQDSIPPGQVPEQDGEQMSGDGAEAALEAWHEADERSREAERRVQEASLAFEIHGTPIPEHLLRDLQRTRTESNARLREAIALARR